MVPDEGSEALRDLVRAREAAKQDQTRARHRLSKFLLRSGQRPPIGVKPWTRPYLIWVAQLRFTQIAQESTRVRQGRGAIPPYCRNQWRKRLPSLT